MYDARHGPRASLLGTAKLRAMASIFSPLVFIKYMIPIRIWAFF